MNRRTVLVVAAVAIIAIALSVFFLFWNGSSSPGTAESTGTPVKSNEAKANTTEETPIPNVPGRFGSGLAGAIDQLLAKLRKGPVSVDDFERLRQQLSADPRAGIAAILAFLRSGDDADTGAQLQIG